MAHRDIVVMGASAGGLQALQQILSATPSDVEAALPFRSAAAAYGRRVIGVVLTGMLGDGTAGLMVISARGGEAIVQDPQSASFPSIPRSALDQVPHMCSLWTRSRPCCCSSFGQELPSEAEPANQPPLGRPRKRASQSSILMRFQAKIAWVIRRLSPVPIAVVCFGKLNRVNFFASAAGWATLIPSSTSGFASRQPAFMRRILPTVLIMEMLSRLSH